MARRLMLWLTVSMVGFWLLAAALGGFVIHEELDEAFDSALGKTAQRLLPLVVDDLFQRRSGGAPVNVGGGGDGGGHLVYQLRDADGAILMRSHDAPPMPFDVPLRSGFHDTADFRVFTLPGVSATVFLQVADPFAERREAIFEALTALLLPVLLLVPASTLALWLILRSSLAPLGRMGREIGKRDGSNLAPLELPRMPPELVDIAASVDRLMDRLRRALEAERSLAANSAHELRTPIAGALAQAQRLAAELPPGSAKDRVRAIETALGGLSRLAEKLLQLARADSGIGAAADPTDLIPVIRMLADDFGRMADYRGRIVLSPLPAGLVRRVDVDAFAIILRNLIENALLHGSADGEVAISADEEGTVTVRNRGSVVPPDRLHRLGERFARGSTRKPGSGLGLAIAAALARQMGATLEFRSPAEDLGEGFEARLRLAHVSRY